MQRPRRSAFAAWGQGAWCALVATAILLPVSAIALGFVTAALFAVVIAALVRGRTAWRPLAFAAGWCSFPALVAGGFLALFGVMNGTWTDWAYSDRFDAAAWRAAREPTGFDRTRLRMLADLRAGGRLDRATREDVVALLGEPDRRDFDLGFRPSDGSDWTAGDWTVGSDATWIDTVVLRVWIGPDGRVVRHEVTAD